MNINLQQLSAAKLYLSPFQDMLVNDLINLIKITKNSYLNDYSFIIAPLSKAYEGFLKDFFLKIDLIDQKQYHSDRFRVGKVLNPTLRYKRYSIFQKLADISSEGEELAQLLWDGWKYGRNRVFHYFPGATKNITLKEAETSINLLIKAINNTGQFWQNNQNHKY